MNINDDKERDDLAECLKSFSNGAKNGRLRAVFAIGLGLDGPLPLVFVEPEDRESLIIAINEELTRMLGFPHHIVSTEKLADFCSQHNISAQDLLDFQASRND